MRVTVEEFKSFLEVVKESVKETAESNPSVSFDFQFKINLDPVFAVSSSEILSRVQALHDAVTKFNSSEFITWELALPITNTLTKDLQEKIQNRMAARETLNAGAGKLITVDGK